jgi:hypothetical protein
MKFSCQREMTFAVITSAFMLVAISCKKSSNSNNNNSSNGSISASINGSAWANSFPIIGAYSTGSGNFDFEGIQLKGGDSTGMALAFLSPTALNQAISSDSGWVDIEYVAPKQVLYDGGQTSGHSILTVTSYDPTSLKIAGTFSGVLYNISGGSDSLVVTNGSFNSTYTSQ